jgi:hypothetical protein
MIRLIPEHHAAPLIWVGILSAETAFRGCDDDYEKTIGEVYDLHGNRGRPGMSPVGMQNGCATRR